MNSFALIMNSSPCFLGEEVSGRQRQIQSEKEQPSLFLLAPFAPVIQKRVRELQDETYKSLYEDLSSQSVSQHVQRCAPIWTQMSTFFVCNKRIA